MLRRDYIQRMIDEFAKVLGHAMQLNASGRRDEALRTIRDSYSTFFEKDAQLLDHLMPGQLIRKLIEDGFTPAQIEVFAEGVRTEADLLMYTDQRSAKDRYVKSLALYEYVESADAGNFSISRRNAIEEIRFCISAM
jgi:hypothetical protein